MSFRTWFSLGYAYPLLSRLNMAILRNGKVFEEQRVHGLCSKCCHVFLMLKQSSARRFMTACGTLTQSSVFVKANTPNTLVAKQDASIAKAQ